MRDEEVKRKRGVSAVGEKSKGVEKMSEKTTKTQPDATSRARDAEPAAVWVPRSALRPWADNPRKNDGAVAAVMASIKRFGFGAPILARKADGEVIAGHTRLKAAEALGLDTVPVRYVDLDPAEAHLLALADNKLNEKAEWDGIKVAEILSGYGLDDAEIAGWGKEELDRLGGAIDSELSDDQSDQANVGFVILIDCDSESDQLRAIDDLMEKGYKCRALT